MRSNQLSYLAILASENTPRQTFGELVLLGFAVADYAPATYLRRHLRRP